MYSLKELYKIGNGPSSSHTMGPKRAAQYFLEKYPDMDSFKVYLYGSLAATGKGHLTDWIIEKTLKNVEVIFDRETKKDHPNTFTIEGYKHGELCCSQTFRSIGGGNLEIEGEGRFTREELYKENTFREIRRYLEENNISLVEYVDRHEDLDDFLKEAITVLYDAIARGLSTEGILHGDLGLRRRAKEVFEGENRFDNIHHLMAYAFAVSEENAAGGEIVTTPTCGACGILPAIMFFMKEMHNTTLQEEINGLKVAGIIGNIVAYNASISGACAGCQAEVGTATSMAAAYATYILKGDIDKIGQAATIALEHNLGLTCDPVGGYVQIPCIERNAFGAARAWDSALLSIGTDAKYSKCSFDLVVKTMLDTGVLLPESLRETSEGGLAKNFYSQC